MPSEVPEPDATRDDEPLFVEYRPNRRRWIGIAAVAGALLVVLTVVYAVRSTVYSPESVVEEYFRALEQRDLDAALAVMTDPPDSELLAPEVLAGDGYTPPADPELRQVSVDGDRAEVEVRFTVAGAGYTTTLQLRRDDGTLDRLFQRWRLDDAVRPLPLSSDPGDRPGEVTVGGVHVFAYDLEGPRELPAVLGGYQVAIPPDDPLWEPGQVTAVVVHPQPDQEVRLRPRARPELRADVERLVGEMLDRCAASAQLSPPACPFGADSELTGVSWEIVAYPDNPRLTAIPDGAGGLGIRVEFGEAGEARLTGVDSGGRERALNQQFEVSGRVVTRDGEPWFECEC